MAHKKLVSVKMASIADVDKLMAEIEKLGNQGATSSKKAIEIAKSMNPHLAEARKVYQAMSSFQKRGFELYKGMNQSFKDLGMEMPESIRQRFDSLENAIDMFEHVLTTNMLEAKNVIDNRY